VGAARRVHPSSLLRAPDDETRRREMRRFVEDLARIAPLVADAGEEADSRP
jgi:hypothetical protein